jgi:hypothetical protein
MHIKDAVAGLWYDGWGDRLALVAEAQRADIDGCFGCGIEVEAKRAQLRKVEIAVALRSEHRIDADDQMDEPGGQ